MNNIELLVSEFAAQLTAQVRQSVLAELRHMSLDQLFALANGESAEARPKASPAAAAKSGGKRGASRPRRAARSASQEASSTASPKKAKKSSSGRLPRRSLADIQSTLEQILAFVQANPGARSEHITAGLGLDKKELPRPLAEGLKAGILTKDGHKRATQYYAAAASETKRGRRR